MSKIQKAPVEAARRQFTTLLAANPNHFGNLVKSSFQPVEKIVADQRFESLSCIGFNPKIELLEATIQIHRPFGYQGGLCTGGSTEYVRFFLSYDGGATWDDAGLVAVNVHDIPTADDCADHPTKPLTFVLTQEIHPDHKFCGTPVLPLVRGILSWEAIPPANNPNYLPVWGNRLDQHIQIRPRRWFLGDVVATLSASGTVAKLPLELSAFEQVPLPFPDPPELELKELAQLYSAPKRTGEAAQRQAPMVEPERFGFAELHGVAAAGSVNVEMLSEQIAQWSALGLSWQGAAEAFGALSGNTSYEQIECLGLDYNREHLSATLRIKRPTGYLGNLCRKGSTEHVAFWADWENTCEWQYLGTARLQVHDIAGIPSDGLAYSAVLKVDLSTVRRPCNQPRVGRVRAVLSWNTPPSTVDPDALPHWGNRLDTHVLIKPGAPDDGTGKINIIGGIPVGEIHINTSGLTKLGARFALQGTLADLLGRACPFGGRVVINGPPVLGARYRVRARPVLGGGSGIVLDQKVRIVDNDGVGSWHYADASGYFTYLPHSQNFFGTLAYFDTGNDGGAWEVRLEVDPPGPGYYWTQWYRVRLDNTQPTAELSLDAGNCEQFKPGTLIKGRFVARDPFFGRFSLHTLPASASPNQPSPPPPPASTAQSAPMPGDVWHLDTTGMKPCGYVVKLDVWDRTISGSGPGSHNYKPADVGFCLIE